MSTKRLASIAMALFSFFCSAFITEAYLCKAIANSEKLEIKSEAETRVKKMYPEFLELVKNGAQENEMISFARKNLDTSTISKRFCGADNEDLVNSIIKFLIWRLKTEAIQSVKEYSLDDSMQVIVKNSSVEVKCKLNNKTEPVNMAVIFSKSDSGIVGIKEIVLLGIPLIEGATQPMKTYFEANGISINSLSPAERAKKCCLALDDFISKNPRQIQKIK